LIEIELVEFLALVVEVEVLVEVGEYKFELAVFV
jgi:hypothetical protein